MTRVLTAAHHGPSVGHSQPWRFLVVTAAELRERAAALADRERLRQADLLEPEAARRLLDLQLEGIREAPIGVVVCCDRRVPATGVLGRATFPDTDMWSCACAIQNLWLAARAEGLGVGWVTLFEPDELAALLELPDGVVTLGWLCLGWPDERPPEPGLVRAGWSRRLPLVQVVLKDRWPPADAAPTPPASHLRGPDQRAVVETRDRADRILTSPGSLGVLDRAVDRVLALRHPDPAAIGLVLVAADHPVALLGVSAYDVSVTRTVVSAAAEGSALGCRLAQQVGAEVTVVDAGVTGPPIAGTLDLRSPGPRGDLVDTPAMSRKQTNELIRAGTLLGKQVGERHGLVALGEVGVGNTTVAAALLGFMLDLAAAEMVGLGAGADSAILDRKCGVVATALARLRSSTTVAPVDPIGCLAELGGPEIAVLVGVTLGAASQRAVIVLDGMAVTTAAVVASALESGLQSHLVAGQRSRERGHAFALRHLGCEPLLDLRIRAGEGAGSVLAAGLVSTAVHARNSAATVEY